MEKASLPRTTGDPFDDMTLLSRGTQRIPGWKRALRPAGQLAVWLVFSLAMLRLPKAPPVDSLLDASWNLCLPYLVQHGAQFGTEVVFTFGPLGFAMPSLYCGTGLWLEVAAAATAAGMFGWVLLETIRPLNWVHRTVAALGMLILIPSSPQTLYLSMVALLGLLLLRDEPPGAFKTVTCCVILGFLSLTKFTNAMLACGVAAVAAGYYLLDGKPKQAALLAGAYALAFSLFWTVCGQSPAGMVPYISTSLEISKGYPDAMYVYESPRAFWRGLSTVLVMVACGVFETVAAKGRIKALARALIFWMTAFLAWEYGFVRADPGHMAGFYLSAVAAVCLYPVFFPFGERWQVARTVLPAVLAGCAIIGIYRLEEGTFAACLPNTAEEMRENFAALSNPAKFKQKLDAGYAAAAKRNAAPRIINAVGTQTVDVFGFQQAVAILNGLRYSPRPVLQSYVAYTPKLAALNGAFMAGDRAPQWILQRYETIDGRYPSMDDGPALRALLDRYTFQFQDSGYVAWRRTEDQKKTLTALPPPVREGDAGMNEEIPVGDLAAGASVWLEVDYSENIRGKLRALLYKPPKVTLVVAVAGQPGTPGKFRFPRMLAREGMLLSPYLDGEYAFLEYAAGLGGPAVQTFKVACDRQNARYLERTFHYRLRILPAPYNLSANRAMADRIRRYPMFDTIPARVEATAMPSRVWLDGLAALEVRAPSEIELLIPPGASRLAGAFGLDPAANKGSGANGARKPEAEFQVVLREGERQRVLFERTLAPGDHPGDLGAQALDVAIPGARAGAMLVLNTFAKAPKESGSDLTCWTGLHFLGENPGR
jgi:hypothetical protein